MNAYTQVLFKNRRPNETILLPEYEKNGGYQGLRAAMKMPPAEVCELVKGSGLRGRGGGGSALGGDGLCEAQELARQRARVGLRDARKGRAKPPT